MRALRLLILTALLLNSCGTLPVVNPVLPQGNSQASICPSFFLTEPYRFIHAIEFGIAGQAGGAVIGVTVADPQTRSVSCAIMTPEGLVLFEAEAASSVRILRALPPFDSGEFAENLLADIRLIFFAPQGRMQEKGILADGALLCRFREENGAWIDVIDRSAQGVEINKYTSLRNWKRRIRFNHSAEGRYAAVELAAREAYGYQLRMKLLEAEPVRGNEQARETGGGKQ